MTRSYSQGGLVDTREAPLHAAAILSIASQGGYGRLRKIQDAVCEALGVTRLEFLSIRRYQRFVDARFVYYHLARTTTLCSLPVIGRYCGGRDHCTVLNGIRVVARYPKKYAALVALVKIEEAGA